MHTMYMRRTAVCAAVGLALSAGQAMATNGMNMEGYGPVATAMGGASMAYDNGTAAMMNNPATLGLMADGENRLDLAVGNLRPDVASSVKGMPIPEASSSGNSYFMPAVGYAMRRGNFTWGAGVFAQGGMGTDYDADSFLAAGTGEKVRSEVSIGRAMVPFAFNVNPQFTVGGSLDFVWGGMDMRMAMDGAGFADFVAGLGGTQTLGTASGSLVDGFVGMAMGGMILSGPNAVRIDFSDDSKFSGSAKGNGFAGKIGLVYEINPQVSIGATYHLKTHMSDMESPDATLTMVGIDLGGGSMDIPVSGKMIINDFQWPETMALGMAYRPNEQWLFVADVKMLNWSGVMDDFTVTFQADDIPQNGGFAGAAMDMTLYQDWSDQTVVMLGAAYSPDKHWTIRGGANLSSNPIPDEYMNPLFPAIVENHFSAGVGYAFNKDQALDVSLTYAPEVEATNPNTGVTTTHSQTNFQLMYSHRF
ncbi:MAG: outer membrane protein transport protein [Ectothiorhodospiraceae bacterium]|nr:outer membrane protein transport protein [Ectothiorhodospiraceae bacterium]